MRKLVFGLATCCVVLIGAMNVRARAADQTLLAGAAKVDITPEPGLRMWGYSTRTKGATGTLDPLMAKAVVLKLGETSVAIVSLDLGRTPEEALLEQLRERTAAVCGISNLFVTASHTHHAPTMEQYTGETNDYPQQVIKHIEDIVVEAAGRLEPVTLGVGHGTADYAHNRRHYLPDGRVAMQWRNAEREPTAPVDKEYTVIRLDSAAGKPLAVLFHYACHPVVMGGDNYLYSADYVGATSGVVEAEFGAPCLFLQGACGDINPYVDKTPLDEGGVEAMRKMGRDLGQQILATAQQIETAPLDPPRLEFVQKEIPTAVRWDVNNSEVYTVLARAYRTRFTNYLAPLLKSGTLPLHLTTLLIGEDLALIGMPGEIFVQFQLELKAASPVKNTLLVGYTHGYHAYFPTIRDAAAGAYGGKTATYVAVGTGERFLNEALIGLHSLMGNLNAVPHEEDFHLLEWDDIKASR